MIKQAERRQQRRFEVRYAKVSYGKPKNVDSDEESSIPHRVANISKGGLSFVSEEPFAEDEESIMELVVSSETPLILRGRVRWTEQLPDSMDRLVGIQFGPFGSSKGLNPLHSLEVLTRLDDQHSN